MKNFTIIFFIVVGITSFLMLNADPIKLHNKTLDSHQKVVFVKYRGFLNVNNGHFVDLKIGSSTFIKSMYYDENNNYLIVQLDNTYYQYCAIPSSTVDEWVQSSSLGRYYNRNIKGNYDCRYNYLPKY